jgi:hypothetical protein
LLHLLLLLRREQREGELMSWLIRPSQALDLVAGSFELSAW